MAHCQRSADPRRPRAGAGAKAATEPRRTQVGRVRRATESRGLSDSVRPCPDRERRVIAVPFRRRLEIIGMIGRGRLDPVADQAFDLGRRQSSTGRRGQGIGTSNDLDRTAYRLDPVDADPTCRFQQQPGGLQRRHRRLPAAPTRPRAKGTAGRRASRRWRRSRNSRPGWDPGCVSSAWSSASGSGRRRAGSWAGPLACG